MINFPDYPIIFYTEKKIKILKKKKLDIISIAELEEIENKTILKEIVQKNIEDFNENEKVMQLIPLFIFKYNFFDKTFRAIGDEIDTIKGLLNFAVVNNFIVNAIEIKSEANFYDIDQPSDLETYNNKKEREQ